jgi:hypothetical protein
MIDIVGSMTESNMISNILFNYITGYKEILLYNNIPQLSINLVQTALNSLITSLSGYTNQDEINSYMQQNYNSSINLKFLIITEEISFIPDNILNCCEIINISRPSKTSYVKCVKNKISKNIINEDITNIKILKFQNEELIVNHKIICNKIINNLINIDELNFLKFRDILYDIFIYDLNITNCVWYILTILVKQNRIKNEDFAKIMIKTYCFFQYYNNNYRPIYHLENYLFFISKIIHGF